MKIICFIIHSISDNCKCVIAHKIIFFASYVLPLIDFKIFQYLYAKWSTQAFCFAHQQSPNWKLYVYKLTIWVHAVLQIIYKRIIFLTRFIIISCTPIERLNSLQKRLPDALTVETFVLFLAQMPLSYWELNPKSEPKTEFVDSVTRTSNLIDKIENSYCMLCVINKRHHQTLRSGVRQNLASPQPAIAIADSKLAPPPISLRLQCVRGGSRA